MKWWTIATETWEKKTNRYAQSNDEIESVPSFLEIVSIDDWLQIIGLSNQ